VRRGRNRTSCVARETLQASDGTSHPYLLSAAEDLPFEGNALSSTIGLANRHSNPTV